MLTGVQWAAFLAPHLPHLLSCRQETKEEYEFWCAKWLLDSGNQKVAQTKLEALYESGQIAL